MRIAITIGNVDRYNVHPYIEGCKDTSTDGTFGPKAYTITYGDGVWNGHQENNVTFTLWANARTCLAFENALTRTAMAKGEECVLVVTDGHECAGAKARLRYAHSNVSL